VTLQKAGTAFKEEIVSDFLGIDTFTASPAHPAGCAIYGVAAATNHEHKPTRRALRCGASVSFPRARRSRFSLVLAGARSSEK
jgi:hypothetical protein